MGQMRLALCIPTYERSELVKDFLTNCSEYYIQAGIDIYYYDSSKSDDTKAVVQSWPDQEHVHYVKLPSEHLLSQKMYMVFQGYGMDQEYDFLWQANDSLQCSRDAVKQIMSCLDKDVDIITINHRDHEKIGPHVFKNPDEYLRVCGWRTSLLGTVILNTRTMLDGVNWELYEKRFINPPWGCDFAQVSFYFCRILELEHFTAFYLPLGNSAIRISALKKCSYWVKNDFFRVHCECWVKTIKNLPFPYTPESKKEASSKLGRFELLPDVSVFVQLRRDHQYSLKVFFHFFRDWKNATAVPGPKLFLAALIPQFCINAFYNMKEKSARHKFEAFYRSHPRIIIYGAGGHGYVYGQYLDAHKLSYDSFCVTHRKPGKYEYCEHPVYEFDELKDLSDTGFIIGLRRANAEAVLRILDGKVERCDIFYSPDFEECVRDELGYKFYGNE